MQEIKITVKDPAGSGYYAVIHSSLLTGKVTGEGSDIFWNYAHHRPLLDYQRLISDSQEFFTKVINNEILAENPDYYIYGTDLTAQLKDKIIYKMSDTAFQGETWITDPITVYKDGDKYHHSGIGGKHRFAAARDMDCYIIVLVEEYDNL